MKDLTKERKHPSLNRKEKWLDLEQDPSHHNQLEPHQDLSPHLPSTTSATKKNEETKNTWKMSRER
jgi:hypothetical protein